MEQDIVDGDSEFLQVETDLFKEDRLLSGRDSAGHPLGNEILLGIPQLSSILEEKMVWNRNDVRNCKIQSSP